MPERLDPYMRFLIEDHFEHPRDDPFIYPLRTTTPEDADHPEDRFVPYEVGAAVMAALWQNGIDPLANPELMNLYTEDALRRIPFAEEKVQLRQKAAHRMNSLLGMG